MLRASVPDRGWSLSGAVLAILSVLTSVVFLAGIPASVGFRAPPAEAARLPGSVRALPATLAVTVRRSEGSAPVPGATVRVFWADGERYYLAASARSDSEGRAIVAPLPSGAVWVLAEAPGLARRSTALVLGEGRRDVEMTLAPAARLGVRVVDDARTPLASATVLVGSADALPFGALTGGDGRAIFERLGSSPWSVRVFARGYEPATRSDVVADVEVTLVRASVLVVTVEDQGGKPVAGATVLVAGTSLWPARRIETAGDGRARVSGLLPGSVDVRAEKGALVSRTEVGVRIGRGDHGVTVRLAAGRMIPVVVTDGEGDHPPVVANADVVLVEGGVSTFPIEGRTGTFGKVTLGPIAPGPAAVSASAEGFVAKPALAVPEDLVGELLVPLLRGATLRGEVVDADGRPIDGASVEVVGTDLDGMPIAATPLAVEFQRVHFAWALGGPAPLVPAGELGVMPGPIPGIPGALPTSELLLPPLVAGKASGVAPWVTSRNGEFRASPVPPGRVRALVRHPAYVESTSDMVILTPGSEARVRVTMRVGGAVEGTVVDSSGLPAAGARVDLAAVQGTLSRSVVSADDGTFAFAALPSEVMLTLARPGDPYHPVLRRRFQIPEGKTTELELVLPEEREPVLVTVEDDSRRPVKLAQVTLLSLDPERPLRATEFTDEAGQVTVPDATGLPLRIVVEAPGFAHASREVDVAPAAVVVELARGVKVEGRVTAVRGRQDVEGASVELLSEGHRRIAFTDALGRYGFDDVTPGRARISISHADYAKADLEVAVVGTGHADRAFEIPAVDLVEPGEVSGRVVDSEGQPVAGARVGVGAVGAYVPVGITAEGTVTTKADGRFHLKRTPPGALVLEAVAAGVGKGRATGVSVESGRVTEDVEIRLEPETAAVDSAATGGVAITLGEGATGAPAGVAIVQVAPGSEAEHAGLLAGDVVRAIDGSTVQSMNEARRMLAGPDGSDVIVEVLRGTDKATLRIRRERVRR